MRNNFVTSSWEKAGIRFISIACFQVILEQKNRTIFGPGKIRKRRADESMPIFGNLLFFFNTGLSFWLTGRFSYSKMENPNPQMEKRENYVFSSGNLSYNDDLPKNPLPFAKRWVFFSLPPLFFFFFFLPSFSFSHFTVVQNNQESRRKYWATCLLALLTHSLTPNCSLHLHDPLRSLVCSFPPKLFHEKSAYISSFF